MSKINKDTLAYLGIDYQLRFLAQVINDHKFGESIIDIVDPNYFEDPYLRVIAVTIKDAMAKYNIIPDAGSLEFRLLNEVKDEIQQKFVIQQLKRVKDASLYDALEVQNVAMQFCKRHELKKALKKIDSIIDRGDEESFHECENILKDALNHGHEKDNGFEVFHDLENVLADDFRDPFRTGIKGLDEVMNGGLARTEMAMILAPFGVGKTTMLTKIANTGMNDGLNVLQIFFEDNPKVIQRKHLSCWSGRDLNDLSMYRDEIITMCDELNKSTKGVLKLKKFPSDSTTVPVIRQYIRKLIAEGFRPDLVILDYIDCVQPSKHYDDINVGEGSVVRQLETLAFELNFALWSATQGNRGAIGAVLVESNQMAGSIKKGMITHFLVSIAKTLEQTENNTASMAILKSRFGKSGVIFEDIYFNNANIQIDMGVKGAVTQVQHTKNVEENKQTRLNMLLDAKKNRDALLNEED